MPWVFTVCGDFFLVLRMMLNMFRPQHPHIKAVHHLAPEYFRHHELRHWRNLEFSWWGPPWWLWWLVTRGQGRKGLGVGIVHWLSVKSNHSGQGLRWVLRFPDSGTVKDKIDSWAYFLCTFQSSNFDVVIKKINKNKSHQPKLSHVTVIKQWNHWALMNTSNTTTVRKRERKRNVLFA